jgi:hypothetical protein
MHINLSKLCTLCVKFAALATGINLKYGHLQVSCPTCTNNYYKPTGMIVVVIRYCDEIMDLFPF